MGGMANVVQLILRLDSANTLISCRELSKELKVSERQVRNYMQLLRDQGIDIEADQTGGGGYSGRKMRLRIPWEIQTKEIHALNSAVKRLEHDDIYTESADLKTLAYKLASRMKDREVYPVIHYHDRITGVHSKNEGDMMLQIERAIAKQKKVLIIYHSASSKTTKSRVVHPYQLEGYEHGLYMKGYCEESEDVRNFKLNRIQKLECLDEMFEIRKWVEDKVKEDGFGIFRQEKYKLVADIKYPFNTYIQEIRIGEDQTNEIIDEDTTRIRVTLNNVHEVVSILLGFGSKVHVSEPAFIKEKILEEAKRMVEINASSIRKQ